MGLGNNEGNALMIKLFDFKKVLVVTTSSSSEVNLGALERVKNCSYELYDRSRSFMRRRCIVSRNFRRQRTITINCLVIGPEMKDVQEEFHFSLGQAFQNENLAYFERVWCIGLAEDLKDRSETMIKVACHVVFKGSPSKYLLQQVAFE